MMSQQATVYEPPLLHSEETLSKKPWERQEGEPARWFLRFRNYLRMGPRRSVNAVFERERQEKAGKATNKAGTRWYEAALRWQWEARAQAWDALVDEQQAAAMRALASQMPFVSRPFRLVQLNTLATALMRKTEEGLALPNFLLCVRTMQSLMHDIADEVAAWGITPDQSADGAALLALVQKNARLKDIERERELDEEAEIERKLSHIAFLEEMAARSKAEREAQQSEDL